MSNKNNNSAISGISSTLIFCVFFMAKVMGYITWSWLWVTAPLWIPFAIFLAVLLLYALIALFC